MSSSCVTAHTDRQPTEASLTAGTQAFSARIGSCQPGDEFANGASAWLTELTVMSKA